MEEKTYIEESNQPQPSNKQTPLERASRILSSVFSPFIVPLIAFLWLFFGTYLNIMPIQYKLFVLSIVFSFTIFMPLVFIYLYQKINGWGIRELEHRKKRFIPYILTIMGYVTCLLVMHNMHFPRYMSGIIIACLICMTISALLNLKWKISTHVAAGGLLVGGLLSYSFIFNFNPIWWLCFFILLSGMVGTARIIIKQHTLSEVAVGFVVGMFCGIIGILFI